jgi:hypothetical protein
VVVSAHQQVAVMAALVVQVVVVLVTDLPQLTTAALVIKAVILQLKELMVATVRTQILVEAAAVVALHRLEMYAVQAMAVTELLQVLLEHQ